MRSRPHEIRPGWLPAPARSRYRVRLYHRSREIWLTYARTRADALRQFDEAQRHREEIRRQGDGVRGTEGYVSALMEKRV